MTEDIDTVTTELMSVILGSVEDAEGRIQKLITSTVPPIQTPCSRSDSDKIAQYQSAIDQVHSTVRIVRRALQRLAGSLSTACNHYVNINTLPDEILSAIFVAAVSEDNAASILNIARTCEKWKRACVNSHKIWSTVHLPFDLIEAKELLSLARMGNHPIGTLTVPWSTIPESVLTSFNSISHLVQHLVLQDWANKMSVTGDFANLRELQVQYGLAPDDQYQPYALGGIFQPIVGTPILTSVVTYDCRLPYVANCYRGLTTLNITYQGMCLKGTHIYSEDGRLSDALRACPGLENLVLIGIPMTTEEAMALARRPPELPRPIPLLRLRQLHLSLWAHALSGLLRHMQTSLSLTKVNLGIYPTEGEANWADGSDVRAALEPTLLDLDISVCLPTLPRVDTMSIQFICHATCVAERPSATFVAQSSFGLLFGRSGSYGQEKRPFGSLRTSWHHLYMSTARSHALRSIHTLHIHETGCFDNSLVLKHFLAQNRQVDQFRALLPQMPHLRTFILSAKHYIGFLNALVLARTRDPESTQERLAPELDVLVFRLICFAEKGKNSILKVAQLVGQLQVREVHVEDCWVTEYRGGESALPVHESERIVVDALRKEGVAFVECSGFREGRPDTL